MAEAELGAAREGERGTQLAASVGYHEVDMLGGHLFGSDYEVAFVFAVLVVDYDYKTAFAEVGDGFFDCVKLYLFHFQ